MIDMDCTSTKKLTSKKDILDVEIMNSGSFAIKLTPTQSQ